jgi:hypothetical protein
MTTSPAPGAYPLAVNDQRCHLGEIGPEQDLWENHGFLFRGETPDGTDVTFWTSPYIVHRGPHSYYSAAMDILQTVLIVGRFSEDEKQVMHDNDFVAAGWSPSEYLPEGAIQVDQSDQRVLWQVGDRRYEDSPPHWTIQGLHADVDFDISLDAFAPPFTVFEHANFADAGIAWYEVYLEGGGSITHGGQRYEPKGHACHERVIVTRDHEPHLMRGRGLFWHHMFGERVQCWVMTAPSADYALSYLMVDGEALRVDAPHVKLEELDFWQDPRSGFRVSSRWHVEVKTGAGTLDVVAGAYARAYYPWSPFADTANILYWMPAEANGTFTRTDGEVIEIRGAKYMGHTNRAYFNTGGGR